MKTIAFSGTPKRVSVEITRPDNSIIYDANDCINNKTSAVKKKVTITLTGTSGTATISAAGGLSLTVTFDANLNTTAANFKNTNAAAYLAKGIVLTNSGANLIFESNAGDDFTTPVITNATTNLAGTVVVTVAHTGVIEQKKKVTLTLSGSSGTGTISEAGGLTKTVTYATSLNATALAFKTANAAAYLEVGIVLTNSSANLIFESNGAGVDFATPVFTQVTTNLAGSAVVTTPNISSDVLTLNDCARDFGGSGLITNMLIESDDTSLSAIEMVVHIFNKPPTAIPDANPFKLLYSEVEKRILSQSVTFDSLVASSTGVIGQASVNKQFNCASTSKDLYIALQRKTGGAAASGKKITVTLFIVQF